MNTKKAWKSPQLIKYGTVEQLTEIQYSDLERLNQMVLNGSSVFGLFASLDGL